MSSLLAGLGSAASSASSAIGSGLSSAGSAVLDGLGSAGSAIGDAGSWIGNQAQSFGDWMTSPSAPNTVGNAQTNPATAYTPNGIKTAYTPNGINSQLWMKLAQMEQQRQKERRLQTAYSLMQNGSNMVNNRRTF